jgi:hypothetical protein
MEHDQKCELWSWQAALNRKGFDILEEEIKIVRLMTQQCCGCGDRKEKKAETFLRDIALMRNLVDAVSQIREGGFKLRTQSFQEVVTPSGEVVSSLNN